MRADRFRIGAQIVVRGVALCAFVAFVSLVVQVRGLVGDRGILPAQQFLEFVADRLDAFERVTKVPSLFWITGAHDPWLVAFCIVGAIASLVVVAGFAQGPLLVVCYALYLSLTHVGQVFLGYQWDMLLNESLVVAAVLAPWSLRASRTWAPSWFAIVVVIALACRLEIGSGLSKLMSGDPTWSTLTALDFHYETQPLPTPLGWLAAHFAEPVQVVSCFFMFVIQLAAPVVVVVAAPFRRVRHAAIVAMTALQIGIALTGNYTFFNALTVILSCVAVDDDAWRTIARRIRRTRANEIAAKPPSTENADHVRSIASQVVRAVFACALVPIGIVAEIDRLAREPMPDAINDVMEAVEPFEIAGGYGLFANMTTERDEIIIEGTLDGVEWRAYEFKHKPGDVDRVPDFVAPHQPRLDWQMWFAALSSPRHARWFAPFLDRLRGAEPVVLSLLASDPFDGRKPIAVRATRWRYHVAPIGSGHAWTREELGPYR